jgi:DNA end-binding protein Ku
MARPLWSGAITFGLLNISVRLISAKESKSIHFKLLDKRDHARIGYKQYNKTTGKEVSKRDIVKGYEYEPGHFVVVTDQDFEYANLKATHTIEIEDFVNLYDLDPLLFERPYFLLPGKNGERGYALLCHVLDRAKKVAIGRIVLHGKQRLVALLARSDYLVCEVIRYAHEVVPNSALDKISERENAAAPSKRELEMAHHLVEHMTVKWNPNKYKDTYYNDLMKRINKKIESGGSIESEDAEYVNTSPSQVLDLMPLLRKSLQATAPKPAKAQRKSKRDNPREPRHGAS